MKSPLKRFGVMVLTAMALVYSFEGSAQKLTTQHRSTDQNVASGQLVQANSNSAADLSNPTASDNVSPFDAVKGKKEDTRKRDAFSKHYINEDGSFTALIGAGPIHYEKNGQFLDINHSISASSDFNYPFANTSNLFESYFGATSHSGVKNKTAEGEIKEFLNTKMYWEVNGQAVNTQNSANKSVRVEGEKAYYDNIYGNISAEFTVLTGKRKLNYIIPNQQALGNIPAGADYLVFTEDVVLPFGWTFEKNEILGILLKNSAGEIMYSIDLPTSNDQNDLGLFNNNTVFTIQQVDQTISIKTKVKTEWLLNSARQFPILVDPTITYRPNNATSETHQMNSGGGGVSGSPAAGLNGGTTWFRGFINFNLSSIPAAQVTNVQINLTANTVVGTFNTSYPIGITQSLYKLPYWASNNTQMYNWVTNANNMTGDYVSINATPTAGLPVTYTLPNQANLDVEAKSGSANSFFSVTLRPGWISGLTTNRYIVYRDHTHATNYPKLIVTYTQNDIYCHPGYTDANCAAFGDCRYVGITNVNIGTINNTTTNNNIPIGYNKYNETTTVEAGASYPLTVRYADAGSPVNPGKVSVWIDWNEDGDFGDLDEHIGILNATSNNQILSFTIDVPPPTTAGIKRLRIRSVYGSEAFSSNDYCTVLGNGETEDYNLNVIVTSGMPKNIVFHNYGGSEQLTYNNSRIDTNTPIFRMSHEAYDANDYQVEINTNPTFVGGTSWLQTFNGTYAINTETNFTFNNSFTPTNNTTYYVRARVRGAANVWNNWTTETYSFTYQTPKDIPDWFQTTQAQFSSNVLSGVMASPSHDVVTQSAGNAIANGSFETDLTGWTKNSNWPSWYVAERDTYWSSLGSASLLMYNNAPGTYGYGNGDYISMYQTVNLTGVSNLLMDANYESASGNVQLRVYVADVTEAAGTSGTLVHTWTPPTGNNSTAINIDLTPNSFTGNKIIKLVYYSTSGTFSTNYRYLNIDNVRTTSLPQGTITSTPIHLASVQAATAYEGITWNQTLGGGEFKLKVQQSPDGISGWVDVAGYDNISETGDGEKTFDLSGMDAYEHIRLVGSLDGANVVLHDWSVQFQAEEPEDCSIETIWNGSSWSQNVPDGSTYKIIFEGDYNSSADPNYPSVTGLVGCSVEVRGNANVVIASGHSLTIDNEIVVDNANGATFTVQSDANLVQINAGVENAGNIIVERSAVVPSLQYNFWTSPVKEQMLYQIYEGILPGKVMKYNTQTNYFNAIPANSKSEFAKGYSIRGSSLPAHAPDVTATFIGIPQNESLDAEENEIALLRVSQRFNLIGNPFPSNLDLQKLNTNASNAGKIENSTFYFWDNTDNTAYNQQGNNYVNQNYAMYNASFGEGTAAPRFEAGEGKKPNGIVKPGQGFIVQATSTTTGGLVFTNDMRTKEVKINGDDEDAVYFKNGNNGAVDDIYGSRPRKDKFWLELVNPADMHIQIAVGYFKEAENTLDTYDSKILSEGVSDNLYSLSEDAHKLTIQGREGPFADTDVIPLGVKFFVQGKYKIQLEHTKGIFKNHQNIYLKDKYLNQIHNLSESFYDFEGTPGVFEDRFEIIFKDESQTSDPVLTTASDNHLKIIKKDRQIEISSSRDKILEVEIFNLSGWSIYKNEKVNSKILNVPASLFGKQIIVVKVLTETGEIETKKIVNK